MAVNLLSSEEYQLVNLLREAHWSESDAVAAVALATRQPSRPFEALAEWLTQYPSLDTRTAGRECLVRLEAEGLVRRQMQANGIGYTAVTDRLLEKLFGVVDAPDALRRSLRVPAAGSVKFFDVGPIGTIEAYSSFQDRLRQAQSSVNYPVMRPSASEGPATILAERAVAGTYVRVLIASDGVVERLWDKGTAYRTQYIPGEWLALARRTPNMEVRVCDSADLMHLATSWSIDGRVARFDLFDATRERPLDGYMFEIEAMNGASINLLGEFDRQFERAWLSSAPASGLARVLWRVRRSWQWILFVVFLALTFLFATNNALANVFASVAATFLLNAIVASREFVQQKVRRFRGSG